MIYSFDLALPTECDDEYWFTPEGEPSFEQPPDKPSTVTAFVYALKLGQILAFAMRTVVSGLSSDSNHQCNLNLPVVLNQQIASAARAVRRAMGPAHRRRPRLCTQQLVGLAPELP